MSDYLNSIAKRLSASSSEIIPVESPQFDDRGSRAIEARQELAGSNSSVAEESIFSNQSRLKNVGQNFEENSTFRPPKKTLRPNDPSDKTTPPRSERASPEIDNTPAIVARNFSAERPQPKFPSISSAGTTENKDPTDDVVHRSRRLHEAQSNRVDADNDKIAIPQPKSRIVQITSQNEVDHEASKWQLATEELPPISQPERHETTSLKFRTQDAISNELETKSLSPSAYADEVQQHKRPEIVPLASLDPQDIPHFEMQTVPVAVETPAPIPETVVNISIGRVEVRANLNRSSPATKSHSSRNSSRDLDNYLRGSNGRSS